MVAQLRRMRTFYAVGATGALVVLSAAFIAALHFSFDVPFSALFHDPNSLAGNPRYYGAVSSVGILIWTAAASIALWTYASARPFHGEQRRRANLCFFGALLTALLVRDDLFILHEALPLMDVPEAAYLAIYGAAHGAFLAAFCRTILRTQWVLLLLSYCSFAVSIVADLFVHLPYSAYSEDMPKFAGILFWAAYFMSVSWTLLQDRLAAPADDMRDA